MAKGAVEVGAETRQRHTGLEGGTVGTGECEGDGVERVSHFMKCETLWKN